MNDIEKQQEEMFFIATDWENDTEDRPDHFWQTAGSSVNEAVNKYMETFHTPPQYVYVVSQQLVAQAPNYL